MIEVRQFISVFSRVVSISPWYYLGCVVIIVGVYFLVRSLEKKRRICTAALCGYMFLILATTVLARASKENAGVNLQLFWTYREVFSRPRGSHGLNIEILLNILMMIPIGVLLPLVTKKKFLFALGIGTLTSIAIELLQYITHRGLCEIDDVFNNVIGVVIGYGIYSIWKQKRGISEENQQG